MAHDYDVAVIGAGLTGTAAARELTARGHSVLLLEQYAVGHERGSSHGSSRIYRRAYADPFYVALTGRAAAEWDRLEDESGVGLRNQPGGLDAGLVGVLDEVGREVSGLEGSGMPALPGGLAGERRPGLAGQPVDQSSSPSSTAAR